MNKRFTASRVPDSGIEVLFATEERWQAWLDIESALALTEADLEMIPREAADAITAACRIERLDLGRIREGITRTSHPLMPLIVELSRVVGEPHGGWVHWGATTQNITQTGDILILRKVHRVILGLLARIMTALANLAERSADMVIAGRTHGQHAVPTAHLSQSAIDALLDPASHTGLSASIAHQQAEVARRFASELHAHLQS
jgi:3-carboxy-cis,cis-muconate cycloisomerase